MAKQGDFAMSPTEKKLAEPLMNLLAPENTKGRKELVINTPGEAIYETFAGDWERIETPELTQAALLDILRLFADRYNESYNVKNPILSFRLPGGHRAQVVAGEQNQMGFSMAIRLFNEREFTIDDYMLSEKDKKDIIDAVQNHKTLLISGGTGSGKTSFMNVILQYVPKEERVLTLEDVRELKVPLHNWVALTFSSGEKKDNAPDINALLNAALRMRPDRILLGEIRKENAFTFCSAINTGHAGSMATIHANDPKSAIDAVINRVLLNGDTMESAINVLRRQLVSDIYGVIQLNRVKGGVRGYFQCLAEEGDLEKYDGEGGVAEPFADHSAEHEEENGHSTEQPAAQPAPVTPVDRPQEKPATMSGADLLKTLTNK